MADSKPFNLDRLISIAALILAIGGSLYSTLHTQNNLEYMTKNDFNSFQIDNVKKMTSLEGTVQNGFAGVSQQLASLNFVGTKDFQEFKDKTVSGQFELQKSIDFLKKDIEILQRNTDQNASKIAAIQTQIAVLEIKKAGEASR